MGNYIEVPKKLTLDMLIGEFGRLAVDFYMDRIEKRLAEGRTYYNPLKTVYLWATKDRQTNQGYYTSYRGYTRRRKNKNFGRS